MNKCPNCGTEFNGKFCPECGTKWQEDKTCPNCGATVKFQAKFCHECGYSFAVKPAEEKAAFPVETKQAEEAAVAASVTQSVNSTETVSGNKADSGVFGKIYGILKYIPVAVFALFAVLSLLFFLAPVAVMKGGEFFGEVIADESLGNLYQVAFGSAEGLEDLAGAAVVLLILTVLSLVLAAANLNATLSNKYKFNKLHIAKFELTLGELLNFVAFAIYLIAFILACVLNGQVGALDEGMDILGGGACQGLIIAFAWVFAVLAAGSMAGRFFIAKQFPDVKAAEDEKLSKLEQEYREKVAQEELNNSENESAAVGEEREAVHTERSAKADFGGKPVGFIINKFVKMRRPVGYICLFIILFVYAGIAFTFIPEPAIQSLGGILLWIEIGLFALILLLSVVVPVNLNSWTPAKILKKSGLGKGLAASIFAILFSCGLLVPVIIFKLEYDIILRRPVFMFALGLTVSICMMLFAIASSKTGEMLTEHFYGSARGSGLAAVSYDAAVAQEDMKNYKSSKHHSGGTKVAVKGNALFAVATCLLFISILVVAIIYPVFTNKFSVNYLSSLSTNNERNAVTTYLGMPNEIRDSEGKLVDDEYIENGTYYYYSDNYIKISEEINQAEKDLLNAIEQENYTRAESLTKQLAQIIKENKDVEFQAIKVSILNYKLYEIEYNSKASLLNLLGADILLYPDLDIDIEDLYTEKKVAKITMDQSSVFISNGLNGVYAKIEYQDGSYKYTNMGNYMVIYDRELGEQNVEWTDDWGEYSARVKFVDTVSGKFGDLDWELKRENYTNVLRITGSGKIETTNGRDYPWTKYSAVINEVIIGNNVTKIGDSAFKDFSALSRVVIGSGIEEMSYSAFSGSNATFYVNMPEQTGWSSSWHGNGQVIWNSDGQLHTYNFNSMGGTYCGPVEAYRLETLPQPTRAGYHFMGWYENEQCNGNPVMAPYGARNGEVTLYAGWMSDEEYSQLKDGSSFEKAITLYIGDDINANISQSGQRLYFAFTPSQSGTFIFQSRGSTDTVANLYTASITSSSIANDDDGENNNFLIRVDLTQGETYYLVVHVHNNGVGNFVVSVGR